jgi:hypothetical protein
MTMSLRWNEPGRRLFVLGDWILPALLCHSKALASHAIALEWHPAQGSDLRPGRMTRPY